MPIILFDYCSIFPSYTIISNIGCLFFQVHNKEEEILSLRSELTSMNEQVIQQQAAMAESSVQLRDQYIEKLEDELDQQKNEASRLVRSTDYNL